MAKETTSNTSAIRSAFSPRVRDGLCRHIRSKGMIINIDEAPENASTQLNYLSVDPHALAWNGTTWWCTQTSKTIGPDDRPCDNGRCTEGRRCYTAEDALV
ncbi:MAG TPA: hypothetical protein VGG33_08510 [Polyangia bacterium]